MLIGALATIIILGLVYVWTPWGTRTANKILAGITVDQGRAPEAEIPAGSRKARCLNNPMTS